MESADKPAIRGWLLVYVIWAYWGTAFSIAINGYELVLIKRAAPFLFVGAMIVFALAVAFFGYYCLMLLKLIRRQQGVVKKIKALILCAPVFNAMLPAIFIGVGMLGNPGLNAAALFNGAYTPGVFGSLAGAAIMAIIWYRYFCVSKRVKSIWPDG